jgi:hypothetical protein
VVGGEGVGELRLAGSRAGEMGTAFDRGVSGGAALFRCCVGGRFEGGTSLQEARLIDLPFSSFWC